MIYHYIILAGQMPISIDISKPVNAPGDLPRMMDYWQLLLI